jgi:hypothetical protein
MSSVTYKVVRGHEIRADVDIPATEGRPAVAALPAR